jgi:hypothetical protein
MSQLQQQLNAELHRLGKGAKTPASAPSGNTNAVFDLAASAIDPDGPPDGLGGGLLPPTGITLAWTERLLGDYDQNGQVNVPDLVPLAAHWLAAVQYDAPALHGASPAGPRAAPRMTAAACIPHRPRRGAARRTGGWRALTATLTRSSG